MPLPEEIGMWLAEVRGALVNLETAVEDQGAKSTQEQGAALRDAEAARQVAEERSARLEERLEEKRAEISKLKSKVETLTKDLKDQESEISKLKQKVNGKEGGRSRSRDGGEDPVKKKRPSPSRSRSRRSHPALCSRSRSRRRSPSATRSRSRRRRESSGRRRGRSRSYGGKSDRGRSDSRDFSPRSGKGGGKGKDSNLCIPYVIGSCRMGNRCPQRHPDEENCKAALDSLKRKPCKWGKECKRSDCVFVHENRENKSNNIPRDRDMPGKGVCRLGADCKRSDCAFTHPRSESEAPGSNNGKMATLCRYGLECKRGDCHFRHPAGWNPRR